jgi:hypothetical protein
MRFRCLVIALALLAAFVSDSWGQSRQKSPEQKPAAQQTGSDLRGTEQSPLIVKVAPALKTDADREAETNERERVAKADKQKEKSDADLVKYTAELALFTEGLFAATVALFVATLGLVVAAMIQSRDMKASIAVNRTAANAALRQANAMVAIESPIFAIRQLKLVGFEDEQGAVPTADPVPPGLPPPFCRPLILMENRGRTEMTINRVFCDWIVAPTIDETPEYHFEEVWNGALVKESAAWFPSQNGIRLNQLEAETIENFGQFLWVYGKIIYTDFMGDQFEHGYIARWTTSQGFVRDPLANYEYKRKI